MERRLDDRGLETLLDAGPLAGVPTRWIEPASGVRMLAMDLSGLSSIGASSFARHRLEGTGWAAYVTVAWGFTSLPGTTWAADAVGELEQRIARYWSQVGTDAQGLLDRASELSETDIGRMLDELDQGWDDFVGADDEAVETTLYLELASTADRHGGSLDPADIPPEIRGVPSRLDRWLCDWELTRGRGILTHRPNPLPGWIVHESNTPTLLVIPFDAAEAVVAVDEFWGANPVLLIALLRRWNARYGTRVVAHYGSGVCLLSEQVPVTVAEAYPLARAMDLVSLELVSTHNFTRRELAYGLMYEHAWWLAGRL